MTGQLSDKGRDLVLYRRFLPRKAPVRKYLPDFGPDCRNFAETNRNHTKENPVWIEKSKDAKANN